MSVPMNKIFQHAGLIVTISCLLIGGLLQLNSRFDKIEYGLIIRDTVLNTKFERQAEINALFKSRLDNHDSQLRSLETSINQRR